ERPSGGPSKGAVHRYVGAPELREAFRADRSGHVRQKPHPLQDGLIPPPLGCVPRRWLAVGHGGAVEHVGSALRSPAGIAGHPIPRKGAIRVDPPVGRLPGRGKISVPVKKCSDWLLRPPFGEHGEPKPLAVHPPADLAARNSVSPVESARTDSSHQPAKQARGIIVKMV